MGAGKVPETARAWTHLSADPSEQGEFFGRLCWYEDGAREDAPAACPIIPVLVIPESAVRDCEHSPKQTYQCSDTQLCFNCGSTRILLLSGRWAKWQLPRILRVPKENKR